MRIVLINFLSMDGVYQGPGSPDEDRTDGFERGGWLVPFVDQTFEEIATEWTASATGFLFGRRTYEAFASVWPTIEDPADRNAAKLNTLPKFVATSKPLETSWKPVTVLDKDIGAQLTAMKAETDGELQIHGSGRLGRSLLAMGLVDELCLATAPVVVGQGRKLFDGIDRSMAFNLLSQKRTPAGLTISRLACSGGALTGEYNRNEANRHTSSPTK